MSILASLGLVKASVHEELLEERDRLFVMLEAEVAGRKTLQAQLREHKPDITAEMNERLSKFRRA